MENFLTAAKLHTHAKRFMDAYSAAMQPLSREFAIPQTAAEILLFLANNPEQNRAADIVRGRGMSKGHVSLSLRSLEDRGLVACRADGSDRRAVHLALTDGAGEIAEDGRAVQREFIRRLREGITPEESAVILSVTRKMGDNIRAMERERGSI